MQITEYEHQILSYNSNRFYIFEMFAISSKRSCWYNGLISGKKYLRMYRMVTISRQIYNKNGLIIIIITTILTNVEIRKKYHRQLQG